MLAINLAVSIVVTAVVAVVALTVTLVPIVLMLRAEHRDLHGSARWWTRRHEDAPESVLDVPRMFNQTSEEEKQELV